MKVILEEKFRTQRYVRFKAVILKDGAKTITFLDVPIHVESRRFFEEFLRILGVSEVEYVAKENT